MPDISMCNSTLCPKRQECYRHEDSGTKPSQWQAYFMVPPLDQHGRCEYFIKVKKNDRTQSQ